MLDAVLRRGLPLEAALDSAARDLDRADDRGLAFAIASEALRRLPDLDALIDRATKRPLPDDAKARFVLRIGLVQALALNTPPHAVLATTLPLVEGGPRRLVHGVIGTVLRQNWSLPDVPSLPDEVMARWMPAWGEKVVEAARRLIAAPPPIDLSLATPEGGEGLDGVSLAPNHLRLPRTGAVTGLSGFAEGGWWVQDLSASIPARLLDAGQGRRVVDLCAAPGGKTMQLAAAGWSVTAVDISESRLARLSENLERTGLSADLVTADALAWSPAEPVDAVLLDAPCSATGIFRRHPDVLHRVRPMAIRSLAEAQKQLIARAADWVKPGGQLVYAVCSLEPEEGEQVLEHFTSSRDDYRVEESRRILPGFHEAEGGADSFFIASLRRA